MIRILIGTFIILAIIAVFLLYHPRHPGNLASPVTDAASWHWIQQGTASGGISFDGDSMKCQILKVDGVSYHLELYQAKTVLIPGRKYHVRFKAKADRPNTIKLTSVINHPDWHPLGLVEEVNIPDNTWKDFDYTFTAIATDGQPDKLPSFLVGYVPGTIWFKDIVVEEA